MWNEPDLDRKRTVADTVDMNVRTAEIIRKNDPNAKISGLALARIVPEKFEEYVKALSDAGKLELFDWLSYHGYDFRPENSYVDVEKMAEILKKYSKKVQLRQGENGAPSKGFLGGALTKHPWTGAFAGKVGLGAACSATTAGASGLRASQFPTCTTPRPTSSKCST